MRMTEFYFPKSFFNNVDINGGAPIVNSLIAGARELQKRLLWCIGRALKVFPEMWKMPYVEFYIELQKELKLTPNEDGDYKKVEHYIRTGLPLPNKSTNEVPITQEDLRNAIKNIFASHVNKAGQNNKQIEVYTQANEYILEIIDELYVHIKAFQEFMPFLTDDFESYLISQLVYREAWPPLETPFTQEDRKLLKESLKKWPLKKIEREQQPNISEEDLYALLSSTERLRKWSESFKQHRPKQKEKQEERQP